MAVDCTQDEAILSAGRSRELVNAIQQLRKAEGLDIADKVEVFYEEKAGVSVVESAVSNNLESLSAKFQGSVPLPKKYAPSWSVVLRSGTAEIGGSSVEVFICRPAVAGKDGLSEELRYYLSTLEPAKIAGKDTLDLKIDGKDYTLKHGTDFWASTGDKMKAVKAC